MQILAAVLFVVGGLFMKWSAGLTRPGPTVGMFLLFGGGAAVQALAMRNAEMGRVYVAVLGIESVMAFVLSVVVLHESASVTKVLAVVLVTAGVMLLGRS